jgi:D-3-phosphoglycerate dehydrogenase / 2-oxoglutarate reductase
LSLHLPLTPESHDMIGAAALELMKPTAVVVNTSRGGIVNEAALYQAIRTSPSFSSSMMCSWCESLTTRTVVLNFGKKIADGLTAEVFDEPAVRSVYIGDAVEVAP